MNRLPKNLLMIITPVALVLLIANTLHANPVLPVGQWVDITAQGLGGTFAEGLSVDPSNPSTIYYCPPDGFAKSIDGGSTWRMVAKVVPNWTGQDHLHHVQHSAVDPENSNRLYATSAVVGNTQGFWVSTDGGENFVLPEGFKKAADSTGYYLYDCYDFATDPSDFNHVLVVSHSAWKWGDSEIGNDAGVLESKDGGGTWIVHKPQPGWGYGHAISFLSNPALGLGNSNTWLLGTQGGGFFRTTDAGKSWAKVSTSGIQHGGGDVYYTKTGVLYASGGDKNLRSTDNGITWTAIGPGGGFNVVMGDGKKLYAMACFSTGGFLTSPETDGLTWTNYNNQTFGQGAYIMAFDPINRIMYSGNWGSGLYALKVDDDATAMKSLVSTSAMHNRTAGADHRMILPHQSTPIKPGVKTYGLRGEKLAGGTQWGTRIVIE